MFKSFSKLNNVYARKLTVTISLYKNVKYSILIPTKNGGKYLRFAIESVLKQNFLNMELVVSNNHSTDGTSEYLSSLVDDRLKVISPKYPLPMAEHYEFMVSHANGEWVTIIGDDDAAMPYFFESLEKITCHHHEIGIISSARAYYFWEDRIPRYENLVLQYRSSPRQKIRSTRVDLLLALLGIKSCFELPQLYTTSIIKRDWILKVKEIQCGFLYHSIIPDIYSSVAFAISFKSYLRIDEPLFWVGTSNKSMGISTRIYEDTAKKLQYSEDRLKLNAAIPQEIHAAGFGPMYLYECLLQYPNKEKLFFLKNITTLFIMGAILREIRKKKFNIKITHKNLLTIFKRYLVFQKLNYIHVFIASLILSVANMVYKTCRYSFLLNLYFCTKLHIKGYLFFSSRNRDAFTNIGLASDFIENRHHD
jgi:glycosyltransferase involved in cell wall biosynthesis